VKLVWVVLALAYGKPSAGVAVAVRAGERAAAGEPVPVAVVVRNRSGHKLTLRPTVEVLVTYPVPGERGCARPATGTQRIAVPAAAEATLAAGDVWVEVANLRLGPGFYKLQAWVHADKGGWVGAAGSERARVVVDGPIPPTMCADNPGWEF